MTIFSNIEFISTFLVMTVWDYPGIITMKPRPCLNKGDTLATPSFEREEF